jgi:ParB family transcriptional regulator, chromosome partitioning protein
MTTPNKKDKEALGKGIRSLLQNIDADLKTASGNLRPAVAENITGIMRIPLDQIETNPKQPRKDFDETALQELSASIRLHDIIQPVTVARLPSGKFRLISGERRFRAGRMAGLKDIPVYVRQANDQQLLELALLENLQREDLNAMEVALSYKRMMDELNYTQEQVSERMGKERSTVANYVRLLKLPPDIQIALRNNQLSMGHARALINVDTVDKQLYLFHEIKNRSLSVRQTEELVRRLYKTPHPVKESVKAGLSEPYRKIEDTLATHFSTRVKLNHNVRGSGSINIEYYSLQELNKILDQLGVQIN